MSEVMPLHLLHGYCFMLSCSSTQTFQVQLAFQRKTHLLRKGEALGQNGEDVAHARCLKLVVQIDQSIYLLTNFFQLPLPSSS